MVNGKEYQGGDYDLSASYSNKTCAQAKVDSVKSMKPLWVYYKPSEPEINVVNPGIHNTHFIRIAVGILMLIFCELLRTGFIVMEMF